MEGGRLMDVLIRFGFTIDEIKNMMDTNQNLEFVNDKDIYLLIEILIKAGCSDEMIKNIFQCNPFCFSQNIHKINHLIIKLYEIGLNSLSWLFDSNPYILNLSDEEIEKFYEAKKQEGMSKEEIIDLLYSNMIM